LLKIENLLESFQAVVTGRYIDSKNSSLLKWIKSLNNNNNNNNNNNTSQ
jgi:hypothetical protein